MMIDRHRHPARRAHHRAGAGMSGDGVAPETARLAIADPPYPMMRAAGGTKQRASRWYGDNPRATSDRPSDVHPAAREWDDDQAHRDLLARLMDEYDGWAIATSPDGIAAYGSLPAAVRIMAWIKPNGQPGAHRLRSCWEPVLLYPPAGRRSNRGGVGQMSDTLICPAPRVGFIGSKPPEWTRWVLDALSYNEATDTVDDLFHGSGLVAAALAQPELVDMVKRPGETAAPTSGEQEDRR